MAKVTLKLEGFGDLQKAFTKAPAVVRKHADMVVGFSALRVANRARSLVPVDTGRLKRAIDFSYVVGSLNASVGLLTDDVFYWRFLEFGTVKRPATPFFRPAAEQERDKFIADMRDIGPDVEHEMAQRGGS